MTLVVLSPLEVPFVHHKLDNDVIYLVADSTPKGYYECYQYIVKSQSTTTTTFYRLRFPYSPNSMSTAEWLLLPTREVIGGRIRWETDFSKYTWEEIQLQPIQESEIQARWPFPHTTSLADLYGNAFFGALAFTCPNLETGLTVIQEYAKKIRSSDQTKHEIAYRCMSRFDVSIQVVMQQLLFAGEEEEDLPFFLLKDAANRSRMRTFFINRLNGDLNAFPSLSPFIQNDRHYVVFGPKCRFLCDPIQLLEMWYDWKLDLLLEEKKRKTDEWYDESSLFFKENTFIRNVVLFSTFSQDFLEADEMGKWRLCMKYYDGDEDLIRHLFQLPIVRFGKDFCETKGRSTYSYSSAQDLLLQRLKD